jgi:O-antigen/teichoic acid export membrane protein
VAFLALYRIDFFFVGHFLDSSALGRYAVAVQLIEAVQKGPDWMATTLAPLIAAGRQGGARLTHRIAAASVAAVAVCGVLVVVLKPWEAVILLHTLGDGYAGVSDLLILLLPRAILHAIMITYAAYLAGHGYSLFHPLAGAVGVAVLIGIDMAFVRTHGLSGAIAGITTAYLAATVVMVVGFRNQVRLVNENVARNRPDDS